MQQIMTVSGPSNMKSVLQSVVDLTLRIHCNEGEGHILIFLTGQDEIEQVCSMIRAALAAEPGNVYGSKGSEQAYDSMLVLPLYSALPADAQQNVFRRAYDDNGRSARKCVVATNIAETSITVPNVRYVIDPGFVKQKAYDPSRHIESLVIVPVSQVSAQQRAGRAGRTAPGICYRLYSSECYDGLMGETVPEIQRSNLANVTLHLKALGIRDVIGFDFLDAPSVEQLCEALVQLYALGAIEGVNGGAITARGMAMSTLPLEPCLSRMLVESLTEDTGSGRNNSSSGKGEGDGTGSFCVRNALAEICAMLSVENIWFTPPQCRQARDSGGKRSDRDRDRNRDRDSTNEKLRRQVDGAHDALRHPLGDHLTYLTVYRSCWGLGGTASANSDRERATDREQIDFKKAERWCHDNFVSFRALKTARSIRAQLLQALGTSHTSPSLPSQFTPIGTVAVNNRVSIDDRDQERDRDRGWGGGLIPYSSERKILRCVAAGLFMNAARLCGNDKMYRSLPLPAWPCANSYSSSSSSYGCTDEVRMLHLHPSSALAYVRAPDFVVYQELVFGSKVFMRHALAIEEAVLKSLQGAYTPQHPLLLSDRSMDSAASQSSAGEALLGKRSRVETGDAHDAIATGHSNNDDGTASGGGPAAVAGSVAAARARFLARKRGSD